MAFRFCCLCIALALALLRCETPPRQRGGVAAAPGAFAAVPAALLPAASEPGLPPIRALLDTASAGSAAAADARLGLLAGAAVRSFYGPAGAPAWTTPADSLTAEATAAWQLLARAAEYGLPADYVSARLLALRDSLRQPAAALHPWQQARLEIYFSDAVLRFMRDLHRGRLRPAAEPARTKAAAGKGEEWQPAPALRAALGQGAGAVAAAVLSGQPTNREYQQLQQALAHWLAQPAPPDSAAAHQAQFERGAVNLERWRWEAWPPAPEYIYINLPAYELQVVAHGAVQARHRVIVGKPDTPTPTLSSSIRSFTLAPDWHVPRSIATREILPRLKKDPSYLAANGLSLYDARGRWLDPFAVRWAGVTAQGFPYTIRQSAGCDNALGNVVFRFANPYSVYLHDTPTRQLFEPPARALSHGCIRLAQPLALAAYLLRRDGRPVRLPSEAECTNQPRREVRLARPLPLFVRYATCTAEAGQLRCFPDVYHRDEAVRQALFGPSPPVGAQ